MRVGVNRWAWGCGRVALLVACRVCGCGTGVSLFTAHEHSQTPTPCPPLPGQQVSTPPTGVRRIRFMPVWSNDLMCGTGGQPSAWMILQLRRMSSPDQWGDGFWLEFLSCELGRHCQEAGSGGGVRAPSRDAHSPGASLHRTSSHHQYQVPRTPREVSFLSQCRSRGQPPEGRSPSYA